MCETIERFQVDMHAFGVSGVLRHSHTYIYTLFFSIIYIAHKKHGDDGTMGIVGLHCMALAATGPGRGKTKVCAFFHVRNHVRYDGYKGTKRMTAYL